MDIGPPKERTYAKWCDVCTPTFQALVWAKQQTSVSRKMLQDPDVIENDVIVLQRRDVCSLSRGDTFDDPIETTCVPSCPRQNPDVSPRNDVSC